MHSAGTCLNFMTLQKINKTQLQLQKSQLPVSPVNGETESELAQAKIPSEEVLGPH